MSVDKFGRHTESVKLQQVAKGPPGEGFKLTPDGDYDIQEKFLKNVPDAVDETDAVNLRVLKSKTRLCLKLHDQIYDVRSKPIRNIPNPTTDTDAVNLKYLKDKCVTFGGGNTVDVKMCNVSNVKWPIKASDAATKSYVDIRVPPLTEQGYSFNNKRLHNVADPTSDSDAVNIKYFKSNTMQRIANDWNCSKKRLKHVSDPLDMEDAVNINYLVRMLGTIFYDMYKRLAPPLDPVYRTTKEEWINKYVTEPYFMSGQTRVTLVLPEKLT